MKSSIAIAALVVASLGVAAGGSVFAQSAPSTAPPVSTDASAPAAGLDPGLDGAGPAGLFHARTNMPGRAMDPAGLMMLACSPRGAEALDVALLRLSYRLDLTADQKPLFDAFRAKALTSETSFADSCKADVPATADNAKPDLLARFKSRLGIEQARLTALNDVLPSFEALYNALTDAQKAELLPQRGMGAMGGGMRHWRGGDDTAPKPAPQG